MSEYEVRFQKGSSVHVITVEAEGLIPAIDEAIHQHFNKYTNALSYEVVSATKIS